MPEPILPDDEFMQTARDYMARVSNHATPPNLAENAVKFAFSRRRRFSLAALLGGTAVVIVGATAAVVVLAFRHGPVASIPAASPLPSATAAPRGSTPTPSAVATPTIVWVDMSPSGMTVRAGSAAGGFHTVTVVAATAQPLDLGAGGQRLLFWEGSTGHVYDLDITTGVITDHGGAAGDAFYGAAFSPDGQRVQYVRQTATNQTQLRVLDFRTGVITPLRTFPSNPLDAPVVWSSGGVAAVQESEPSLGGPGGFSASGFAVLDPSTGARVAATPLPGTFGAGAIGADGKHAAIAGNTPLGEIFVAPYLPVGGLDNTLFTVDIGSAPVPVLKETYHQLGVLAMSPDGSTILYSDIPAPGRPLAGITRSPDYGLFTYARGQRTQIAHDNDPTGGLGFNGAAFLDSTELVVVDSSGPTTKLLRWSAGALTPIDSAEGGGTGTVYVIAG